MQGEVAISHRLDVKSYTSLHTLVNDMFPPTSMIGQVRNACLDDEIKPVTFRYFIYWDYIVIFGCKIRGLNILLLELQKVQCDRTYCISSSSFILAFVVLGVWLHYVIDLFFAVT